MSDLFPADAPRHTARNVNLLHAAELAAAGFNTRLAVMITKLTSTMWCAYLFAALSLIGLFGLLGLLNPFTFLLATWVSQQFLQLVFLPILSVGQSVLNRHQEIQADEQFSTTQHIFTDIEKVMQHLDEQDTHILAILERLEAIHAAK